MIGVESSLGQPWAGGSPKEGRYIFKVLDHCSGLVLDGGEEVGKFISQPISAEAIPWNFTADLRDLKIEQSEVMKVLGFMELIFCFGCSVSLRK